MTSSKRSILLRSVDFLKEKLGIDQAVSFVLIGRGVSILSQPATLFFVGRFLSPVEQGFYFTFSNIVFISILLELGLGTIITQFASHEFAHLKWNEDNTLGGEKKAMGRIGSLGVLTIKWYLVMAALFAAIVIPAGISFFRSGSGNISYQWPWVCLVIFSSLNLVIYSFTSILEGCAKVLEVQRIRMIQSIAGNVLIWVLLFSHAGLFAAAALAFMQCVIGIAWIRLRYYKFIRQIFSIKPSPENSISWRYEILPLQWRIGLSWISGYFLAQLINPLLFKYQGPVVAGQMGMTISISNIAAVVGLAWITTKSPTYGSYIRLNKLAELRKIVRSNAAFAVFASFVVSIFILLAAIFIKQYFPEFGDKFLSIFCLIILLVYNLSNLLIAAIATYLRSFKEEPFLYLSILSASLTAVGIFFTARSGNTNLLCLVMLCVNVLFGLPYALLILRKVEQRLNIDSNSQVE